MGEEVGIDFVSELLALNFDNHHNEDRLFEQVAKVEDERFSEALIERALAGERVTHHASRYIRKDTSISQERLLAACRQKPYHSYHRIISPLLDGESLVTLFSELFAVRTALRGAKSSERKTLGDTHNLLEDTLKNADKNSLAEVILGLAPDGPTEIADISDIVMRSYRNDYGNDEREPLHADLRERLVELLAEWGARLVDDRTGDRHALHSLAEAMATFPSTGLLTPLRQLLLADLRIWRQEKEEFDASIKGGKRPDPASEARISYAFRYGQNMLSLAQGHNADISRDEGGQGEVPVSPEMTNAVIDVLSEFIPNYEFGEDAARVIATLRPDPILEIGNPRQFVSDDVLVARERREARLKGDVDVIGPYAERVLSAIDDLRTEDSPEALRHAIALSTSAIRMGCGERLSSLTELVVEHGSLEAISRHMLLRLLFGHDVDGGVAERCLDQLDARRDEREWEYEQDWFKWQQLLVLMIFGGKPQEAASRLLTYDHRMRNHDEQRIIEALGACGHADALQALALLRNRCAERHAMHEWDSAVYAIGNADAGDLLLTAFLEVPDQGGSHRDRRISEMIAALVAKHGRLRQRLLDLARNADVASLRKVGDVVRHIEDEEFFVGLIELPGDRLKMLGGAIADALRDLCVEHQPIEGSGNTYEIVPRPVRKLRARLFARSSTTDSGSEVCRRLLGHIDQIREDYGRPAGEARHPDIRIGQPWPVVARTAWEASFKLIQEVS